MLSVCLIITSPLISTYFGESKSNWSLTGIWQENFEVSWVFGMSPYLALDGVGGRLVAAVLAVRAVVLVQQLVELLGVLAVVALAGGGRLAGALAPAACRLRE